MDVLAELESMAINVADADDEPISNATIQRWEMLFGFTPSEASAAIETHRQDFSRIRVGHELWDAIKVGNEAKGHDRESYEYSLRNQHVPKGGSPSAAASERKATFIVQLAGPLNSPARVQEAAALDRAPALVKGVGENGESHFCEIDTAAKANLQKWVSEHQAGFQPTIVRLSKAKKELCRHSLAPMLGKECVLPQHRADEAGFRPSPSADQYPVWYFFYGTLADPDVLSRHLGLEIKAQYLEAETVGGRIHTWAGKYKALVDAPGETVAGSAFKVESREQEDALRFYETDHYEVVRCQIATRLGVLDGLTFRFDGEKDLA